MNCIWLNFFPDCLKCYSIFCFRILKIVGFILFLECIASRCKRCLSILVLVFCNCAFICFIWPSMMVFNLNLIILQSTYWKIENLHVTYTFLFFTLLSDYQSVALKRSWKVKHMYETSTFVSTYNSKIL